MSANFKHQSIVPMEEATNHWEPVINSIPAFSQPNERTESSNNKSNSPNTDQPLSVSPSMRPKASKRPISAAKNSKNKITLPSTNTKKILLPSIISLIFLLVIVDLAAIFLGSAMFIWSFTNTTNQVEEHISAINNVQILRKITSGMNLAQQGSTLGYKYLREAQKQLRNNDDTNLIISSKEIITLEKEINNVLKHENTIVALSKAAGLATKSPMVELGKLMVENANRNGANISDLRSTEDLLTQLRVLSKLMGGLFERKDDGREVQLQQLTKNAQALHEHMLFLANGNAARLGKSPIINPQLRASLADLLKIITELREQLPQNDIFSEIKNAIEQSEKIINNASTSFLRDSTDLRIEREMFYISIALLILAFILTIVISWLFIRDRRKNIEAMNEEREQLQKNNKLNQQGIIRLMDDLRHLADGDLTIRTTVSEDITGSIADSINLTIQEFSNLVERINESTSRVARATESTKKTSRNLLDAAEQQVSHIQQTGRAALEVARALSDASENARKSAATARSSLEVAERGSSAVRDTLNGMTEIRDQIQETAQRIKRLGESSLEIGEIVEIINDITEQTNVLALNAAIQAASSGEAGRGFGIVAQEVQRLAERSAQATQQIAHIVKAIQTDTGNAIAAMEHSTQSVIKGSERAKSADQAIGELHTVATDMAKSVEQISELTLKHSQSASVVTKQMQEVLRFTNQTAADTKQTADSIEELSRVAVELKTSVAGFRVH